MVRVMGKCNAVKSLQRRSLACGDGFPCITERWEHERLRLCESVFETAKVVLVFYCCMAWRLCFRDAATAGGLATYGSRKQKDIF